jgi:hypothetical protein
MHHRIILPKIISASVAPTMHHRIILLNIIIASAAGMG